MIPPRKPHNEDSNVDSWLMSYADMITLLLCFFIIFVSVTKPRKEEISAITNGMAGKFGTVELATPFEGVYHSLQAVAETNNILHDFSIEKTENGLEMEIATGAFFKPNSAEIDPKKIPVLTELAGALAKVDYINYSIIVEGYTSDVPAQSTLYPTNWEFSTARASSLVRFFIEQGVKPDHLKAVGYADTQPKVPNLDTNNIPIPENRTINERMVVKIERRV